MKYWLGACAAVLLLAACHDGSVDTSNQGAMSASHTSPLSTLTAGRSMGGTSIANAPDHGALLEYGNGGKPMKREGAHTWYPVQVSEEHAIRAIVDGEMTIPYPAGNQAKLRYERHVEGPDGNWSWIGRIEGGDPGQEAIFTFGEKAVFGSIPQPNGQPPLELRSSNGSLWAVTSDPDKLVAPDTAGDTKIPASDAGVSASTSTLAEARHVTAGAVAASATQAAGNTIDVAIGYTSGFRAVHGSQSAAVTRLNFLIEVGNQTFRNSNVNGYLRLVHALEVNYTDATSNSSALEQLTGKDVNNNNVVIPASLAPLRSARDTYGADIAIMVRKFGTPENEGCGIAWLNGSEGQPISPTSDANYGYAIVSDGSDTGTDGKTYYCTDETLIHEAAHLMGSAHDVANSEEQGAFPYSYGYVSASYNFHTVMAYGDATQTLYRTFSNPQSTYCGGRVCGIANQADNARSLNLTVSLVAKFRSSVSLTRSDLIAVKRSGSGGKTEVHPLSGPSGYAQYSTHLATSLASTGNEQDWGFQLADYNNDGIADLYAIKKNGGSGRTEVHVLDGARRYGSYLTHLATARGRTGTDGRWQFLLGDYNLDGKMDLYAIDRMGGSGRTDVHILDGASRFSSHLLHAASALSATGTTGNWDFDLGDYDRDGRPDLYAIKKNGGSGKTEVHVLSGKDRFGRYLTHRATGLGVTGNDNSWDFELGDYNQDGVLDIYGVKKISGSGRTEIHILDGLTNFQTFLLHRASPLSNTGTDHGWLFLLQK